MSRAAHERAFMALRRAVVATSTADNEHEIDDAVAEAVTVLQRELVQTVNDNLTGEIASIRQLVGARPGQTTYEAVRAYVAAEVVAAKRAAAADVEVRMGAGNERRPG